MSGKPTVFIHTNDKQMLGAEVGRWSLKRNSRTPDAFEVEIIRTEDHPFLQEREGQTFLRDGAKRVWRMDDLQSFTPLRFLPPELCGYEGRAVVVDPDVFAVGDVMELLTRDMGGKGVMCRPRAGNVGLGGCLATSVMLMDCARLTHWKARETFASLFRFEADYMDWICLKLEPRENIGLIEPEWNDFDRLTPQTRLIHNTKRLTQPWKAGLPIDFAFADKGFHLLEPKSWLKSVKQAASRKTSARHYLSHPDSRQEALFFGLLKECLEQGLVREEEVRAEMARNHVRHDAFEVLDRTPPLPPAPGLTPQFFH